MSGALALAIVLAIGVAGLSLAIHAQRPMEGDAAVDPGLFPPKRTEQPRLQRTRRHPKEERESTPPVVDVTASETDRGESPPRPPELITSGRPAQAKVVNVVDERVVGPVTKARLTLKFTPEGGDELELQLRHNFPTKAERSRVRIGGTVAVRYDPDDPRRVVLDPGEAGKAG